MTVLGVVMDPVATIKVKKDSTLAMLRAAEGRGWSLVYLEQHDLFWREGRAFGRMRPLRLTPEGPNWCELGESKVAPLATLDIILMRKDPPFDMEYIYSTYLLEHAEREGALVLNRPRSLRDFNEKVFITAFPQCLVPTLVSAQPDLIRAFWREHGDIVIKPLHGMGGLSIFRLGPDDPNANVAIETLTAQGTRTIMAQRFVPEIAQGDKRILTIDGEPVPFALARIPAPGDIRGNLAAGARGEARPLSERDRWICAQVGPRLREAGILFCGLDVIGEYLSEINITSPTGIRELDAACGLDIGAQVIDAADRRYRARGDARHL